MTSHHAQEALAIDVQTPRGRVPDHIGIIPDGNRRWATGQGKAKRDGYSHGIGPAFQVYEYCRKLGIKEVSIYGFTQENTRRPRDQREAYQEACVRAVDRLTALDADFLVVGNVDSDMFPPELKSYTERTRLGRGGLKVNLLVNYSWRWDIDQLRRNGAIGSSDVSDIEMVIRWGGRCRLSGFLPVQCAYADIFVLDDLWPDYRDEHMDRAMAWYQEQDVTKGG